MQQLHKAMIKELMHGAHDERVIAFFAARGQEAFSEPARAAATPVAPAPVPAAAAASSTSSLGVPEMAPETGTIPAPAPPLAPPIIQVTGVVAGSLDSGPARRSAQAVPVAPAPQAKATPRPVIMVKPMKRSPMVFASSADGVVVQRNVVVSASAPGTSEMAAVSEPRAPKIRPAAVVGETSATSPPQASGASPSASAAAARGRGSASDKAFSDLVSDKSLDEVILEYLSDDSEPERR